ncbi:peptidylprolyl isomerase [Roseivirga sp.]|uniref:peptidylprolyl isomerase n=1 Tax=Roseivirga sp. TaxID=1964215 RepID=UPI002B278A45|nr:peptidylprolyl isomerase [Roseivirga sp.]
MRFLVLLIFCFYSFAPVSAFQSNTNVAQINGTPISKAEFLYAFHKNQKADTPIIYDSLEKYLNQYIDFKLKVLAAKKAGIDVSEAFQEEYNGYIAQIQKPYLQNPVSEESLILEVYNRLKYEVNASHILIRIANESNPMDTLAAYEKTDSLRSLAVNGADFWLLAKNNSQDGSAKDGGSLGWFTAMSMVYPFENGAYETPVDGISKIIRSQFGYHIIKVNDKRQAKGRIKTSHIFLTKNDRSRESGNQLIKTIYDSIQNGGDWKALCKQYTEDSQTQLNGGSLPFAGTGQLPEEFLNVAYSIETPGDIATPLEASYGWHIIRLDAIEQMPSLEELRSKISENIRRSGRNQLSPEVLVNKLKHENGFEQDLPRLQNTIAQIAAVGLPNIDLASLSTQTIFKIGEKEVPFSDFFNSLGNANQITLTSLWNRYILFEREEIIQYEDSLAAQKYPEYGFLLDEYKEGLMLFEIMEKEVWNKAAEDSIGLNSFFKSNKKNYVAPERASVWVIESVDSESLEKVSSNFTWNQNMSLEKTLKAQLDPQVFSALKIAKRTYQRDDLPNFAHNWKEQILFSQPAENRIYAIEEIIPEGLYRLEEIKGLVMADYQDWLEKDWVKSLRKANKIDIDTKILRQIASDEKR